MMTLAKILGLPLIKKGFEWLMGRQEGSQKAQAYKHQWEVIQARRASTFLRVLTYLTVWLPIYFAAYLAVVAAWPIENPEEVATIIESTFSAFPWWYTSAAVTILLAVWGIREAQDISITKAIAGKEKARSEAGKALQERKLEETRRR